MHIERIIMARMRHALSAVIFGRMVLTSIVTGGQRYSFFGKIVHLRRFFYTFAKKTTFPDGTLSVRERCIGYLRRSGLVYQADALLRGNTPKQGPADELQLLA